jgi:hypothetical protein
MKEKGYHLTLAPLYALSLNPATVVEREKRLVCERLSPRPVVAGGAWWMIGPRSREPSSRLAYPLIAS